MLKEHGNLFERSNQDRKAAVFKGACFTTWCTICSDGQASHLLLLLLFLYMPTASGDCALFVSCGPC